MSSTSLVAGTILGVLALCAGAHAQPAARPAPPAPGSTVILCRADEPGPRLLIDGRVTDPSGRPVPGAVVSAYNTDANGLYNPPNSPTREPRIQGVAIADAEGRFQMLTVRPGPYPNADDPAHMHFKVTAPTFHLTYSTIWFEGDPLLSPAKRAFADRDAETEIVRTTRPDGGLETAVHAIVLRPD